jgi:Tol biopolymer transport system component
VSWLVKSVGKPDARNGHVRFDERGRETTAAERLRSSALPRLYPDGRRLAYWALGNSGSPDILTAPVEGDPGHLRLGKPDLFLGTPLAEIQPAFSPDGRWIAYTSNESGAYEVYVRAFPRGISGAGKWQISSGGGLCPVWSRNGRELLFETLDDRIMSVSYTANRDSFVPGKTRRWTETPLYNVGAASSYDLAPDR